jgi:hypothetical protein
MNLKGNPHLGDSQEQPEPGLNLEIHDPKRGSIKLRLSQKVAEISVPLLIVLVVLGGGLWFWFNHSPYSLSPAEPGKIEALPRQ